MVVILNNNKNPEKDLYWFGLSENIKILNGIINDKTKAKAIMYIKTPITNGIRTWENICKAVLFDERIEIKNEDLIC